MIREESRVRRLLHSEAPLVVVEAPAGCGKTHEATSYAIAEAKRTSRRVLVLTHTHAAADEFSTRSDGERDGIEVRTIDSLITEIAAAYRTSLGLPGDVSAWVRRHPDGYEKQAKLVAELLRIAPEPASALAGRYSAAVFDEHQDATEDQSELVYSLHRAGARVRIFGDPMQAIYPDKSSTTAVERWAKLSAEASERCFLDHPHRWDRHASELGQWILQARSALKQGDPVDLTGNLPRSLTLLRADNSTDAYGQYRTPSSEGLPIRRLVRQGDTLVLTPHGRMVKALRAFFFRQIPVWEGHVREALDSLTSDLMKSNGDPPAIAAAFVGFVQATSKGFSDSAFGDRLVSEVASKCASNTRGKPAKLQDVGRHIVRNPDHRGVAAALRHLWELARTEDAFASVEIDYPTEYWDAIRLGSFDNPEDGCSEIARRRAWSRPPMPPSAISTIHKAKGLERDNVLVIPCDARHFADSDRARKLLYVAISRARTSLTLVVPTTGASRLLRIA